MSCPEAPQSPEKIVYRRALTCALRNIRPIVGAIRIRDGALKELVLEPSVCVGAISMSELNFNEDVGLSSFVKPAVELTWSDGIAEAPVRRSSPGLAANRDYFDREDWASSYLKYCHRSESFKQRWLAATGDWSDKIVVDVGCGPGNVNATLQQSPRLLIGIDISLGALKMARQFGYIALRADAQDIPLISSFADLVVINAAIHHCDNMAMALSESARLVAPGGLLFIDHDPQLEAWNFRGPGLALWKSRLLIYRLAKKGFHRSMEEQSVALASEIHHDAGDGVTRRFFESQLIPRGFSVELFPHNHELGAEVLNGQIGRASLKLRVGQLLSGINPNSSTAALSLMCRASRNSASETSSSALRSFDKSAPTH
jgi:SAM-dependent methyltransferase